MTRMAGSRNFLQIWAGQLISAVGSRMSSFAMGIWVLQTTGSTTQFALTFIAMNIPALVVGPFAGALVDRWDRRRLMIACAACSAAAMIVLAGLLAGGHLAIWHIYIGIGVVSLCNTFHMPAFSASIPLLAGREQLPRVNGMVQTGNAIASIVAPLAAGVLVTTIDLHGVLIIDALSYLAACAALSISTIPRPARSAGQAGGGLLEEAAVGWRYVYQRPGLIGLLAVTSFNGFVFSIAGVLITPLLLSFSSTAMVGVQYATSGVGMLLGGMAVATFGGPKQRIHGILGSTLLAGICLACHGLRPSFALVAAAGFIMFTMLPVIASSNNSLWQSKVPADLQGRCFAIQHVLSNGITPFGFSLAGPLAEYVFEPLLLSGGVLAESMGTLVGVGPGRGTALLFIVLGALMSSMALSAYAVRAVRNVDALPDALAEPEDSRAMPAAAPPREAVTFDEPRVALSQEAR
jgi:MFS family permease